MYRIIQVKILARCHRLGENVRTLLQMAEAAAPSPPRDTGHGRRPVWSSPQSCQGGFCQPRRTVPEWEEERVLSRSHGWEGHRLWVLAPALPVNFCHSGASLKSWTGRRTRLPASDHALPALPAPIPPWLSPDHRLRFILSVCVADRHPLPHPVCPRTSCDPSCSAPAVLVALCLSVRAVS